MSSYSAATRTITISGTWANVPDSTSIYSIGQSTTDTAGNISGLFYLPGAIFKIGERTFQFIDNNTNNTKKGKYKICQTDSLFWAFYIIKNGLMEYELNRVFNIFKIELSILL